MGPWVEVGTDLGLWEGAWDKWGVSLNSLNNSFSNNNNPNPSPFNSPMEEEVETIIIMSLELVIVIKVV